MTGIQTWLEAHGLGKYAEAFVAQDISVDLLPDLSESDLKDLGVASLGDRKRLLKALAASAQVLDAAAAPTAHSDAAPNLAPGALPGASVDAVLARPLSAEAQRSPSAAPEEGERRHASVMFSDLTGYTALNEAFDPEEVEAVMARVKGAAIAVIERHGGRVNQFVGDEVMAMFGVPVARRDDPQRAVRAALELHQEVDAIAAGLAERLGRRLSMHSGIQSGLVVARRSDSRSGDYTLTGDTVNTAARLRGLAEPGQLVVSPQTWQQVSDYFEGEAGAAVEVKGKERPLVPWRILRERPLPRAGSRPLVGRSEEMQQFDTLVQACVSRHRGRVVFLRGDPGMGKSRLAAEFLAVAREQGLLCHGSAILDFGARTGHDAMRRLAQSLLGLPSDADEPSRIEAIVAFEAAAGAAHAPFLYDLLDAAAPAQVHALLSAIDVAVRQKGSLDALCELARLAGANRPNLLLVEDIQWADAWTLKQLGALAALTSRQPLLLLMTTRFAGDPSIGDWRSALHGLPVGSIDLGPLASEDALRLAAGAASMSEVLLRSCVERAEGNPLFLEQLLLNAGEEGAVSLPGSIQALIQARMDRLQAGDKAALQAAAVWGPRVPLDALRHLLGEAAFDPRALVEQFLLRPDGDELEFCHALIRDGAYGSLLHARRRQLHLAAAQWIEPRDVALAAEHYERAEDSRAPDAYLRASQALAVRFKYLDALSLVERGLKVAPAVADCGPCFGLKLARARILLEVGRTAEAMQASEAAIEAAGPGAERALCLIERAAALRLLDRQAEGLALLDEAQPLAEQAGLTLELSRLHHLRGNLVFGLGQTQLCQREHERALELARQAGSIEAEAAALGGVGDALYAQARIHTAQVVLHRCVALARQHGLLRVEVPYQSMLGWCSLYMMNVDEAVHASRSSIELARRVSHRRGELLACAQTALMDGWHRGNVTPSLALLDQAQALARSLGSQRFEAMVWMFRAMLALRTGERDVARRHVQMALQSSGEVNLRFIGAQLWGVAARIETQPQAILQALARGEALLGDGAVSHTYLFFYDAAILGCIEAGAWDEAERYCAGLEAFIAAEPFTWGQFVVAQGRALASLGRGERSADLLARLQALRAQAQQSQSLVYVPALDAALARLST
jgi:class 3 adenylate cyclase/tetratricopeptide (TPR) repeat protein